MKHRTHTRSGALWTLLGLSIACSFGGCSGSAGFLGLQDYQRDLLFSLGGGLAGALLGDMINGPEDGQAARPAAGPAGPQGPAGPPLFAIFVDTFFRGVVDDVFGLVPLPADDPKLAAEAGPLAFRVAIPTNYATLSPISMRLLMYRTGPCESTCFVFSLDARRAQADDAQPQCFGGTLADCSDGTRWVRIEDACDSTSLGSADVRVFRTVDLPLGAGGLELPDVMPGDLLAFEIDAFASEGGTWHLMGVEFSDAGDGVAGGTVYRSHDQIPPECSPTP